MNATKAANMEPLVTSSPFDAPLPFEPPWSKTPMPVAAVPDALDVPLPESEPEPDPELEPDPEPESPPTPVPSVPPAPDRPGTVARLVGVGVADAPFLDDVDDDVLDGLGFPLFMSVPSARNEPSTVGLFVSSTSPSSPSTLPYLYDTVPVPFASFGAE